MRRDHAEQIWEAISVFLKSPSPKVKEMFIEKIESVNLKPGKEARPDPKKDYINDARNWAKEFLESNPDVCVQDVIDGIGVPSHLTPDVVGGIFKHSDFVKVGTKKIVMPKGHRPRQKTVNAYVLAGSSRDPSLIVDWN